MLKRPHEQSLALFGEPVAVEVGGCDGAFLISLDFPKNARQRKAALFGGFESAGDCYLGIYVDFGIFSGAVGGNNEDAKVDTGLWACKPDAAEPDEIVICSAEITLRTSGKPRRSWDNISPVNFENPAIVDFSISFSIFITLCLTSSAFTFFVTMA